MDCPHCKKPVQYPGYAYSNVYHYGSPVTVKSDCCGRPLRITRVITMRIDPSTTKETHDDWGQPYTRKKN